MTEDQLRLEIRKRQQKLASITKVDGDAEKSIAHCTLQCDYWRLTFALAASEVTSTDDKVRAQAKGMLRLASREAENWESRRQQALKYRKADDLAACRRMMEDLMSEGAKFDELSD